MPNFRQSCSSHPPLSKTPPNIQQIVFLHMENLTWHKTKLGTMAGTTVLYTQYPARVTNGGGNGSGRGVDCGSIVMEQVGGMRVRDPRSYRQREVGEEGGAGG